LLISVALHLVLAWWFARARPGAPEGPQAPPPIEVQVIQVPAPVSRAPAPPAAPAPPRRPREPVPAPERPPEVEPPPETAVQEPSAGGVPRQVDLMPRLALPGEGPAGPGRTRSNRPETAEEHGAAVAEEAGRVKGRVQEWMAADVGAIKAELGLIDPYFGSVRGALQKAVERGAPDGMPGRNVGQQLVDAVLSGASVYGKTGNPYGEGQVPYASPKEREFTGHAEEMARRYQGSALQPRPPIPDGTGRTPLPNPADRPRGLTTEQMQQCADQGKLLDDFLNGKFGGGLAAVVELTQGPDGKLLGTRLVTPSGLHAFDQHVLSVAPAALETLPPPPDRGFGINPAGMRSLWRFEGRVKFKRPLKEWDPLTGSLTGTLVGALYGLACPGLGPPITFDSATGEMELIDLAHPKFTCQVKLIRVE
jgi:hypothetical protein